jgi:hypothetical protein
MIIKKKWKNLLVGLSDHVGPCLLDWAKRVPSRYLGSMGQGRAGPAHLTALAATVSPLLFLLFSLKMIWLKSKIVIEIADCLI